MSLDKSKIIADKARVEQIRAAHKSAKPKDSNPAWKNCEMDIGWLLQYIDSIQPNMEVIRGLSEMCDSATKALPLHSFIISEKDLFPVAEFIFTKFMLPPSKS